MSSPHGGVDWTVTSDVAEVQTMKGLGSMATSRTVGGKKKGPLMIVYMLVSEVKYYGSFYFMENANVIIFIYILSTN